MSKLYLKFAKWQGWTKPLKIHLKDAGIPGVRHRQLFVMNQVSTKARISSSRYVTGGPALLKKVSVFA